MKKILSILKKSIISIIIIIVLLFVQVNLELRLPDYTSKIINIGIQQGGIENNIFEVIRESQLKKIMIFTNNDEDKIILNSYNLITNKDNEYLKKYPLLKNENLYLLNNLEEKEINELSKILKTPSLILSAIESNKIDLSQMNQNLGNKTNEEILQIMSFMSDNELFPIINSFEENFNKMSDSIINQASISSVKSEYIAINYDVDKLQVNYIVKAGIQMVLIALLAMAITILIAFLSSKVGAVFSRDLRKETVFKVMHFSSKEFNELSQASLITRSTNDIQQIQMLVIMSLRMIIYAPILGFGALSKVSSSPLSWIIAVAVFTIMTFIIFIFVFALPKFKKVQELIDKLNLVSREIITGLPVIRAFANEKYEENRFDKANKDLTKVNLFVNRTMTIMMPTMMFIMNSVSILIVWFGADKIDTGNMQVGDLMAFITYTMQIIISFLMFAMLSIILPRSLVSVKRIKEIFNTKISVKEKDNLIKFDDKIKGKLEFKDVYFRYPDAEEDVLQNISFTALPGTTTAFIGSTGSGKSTLINLIPRFFDVTGGKILLNNINIKDVSLYDLRNKIGFVPQKGMLFSGTIESNIKFGADQINDDEVKKAAQIAQALEFIENKEEKYQSEISQGGNNVSGGQRQRLSIARAIAKNPEIYIFDDSFSALDYKTDIKLRKALKKYTSESTILIVAQRISTVMHADQIIVLDEGEIVGIGTHEELLKNNLVYKEIALSQLSEEELNNE
ncbi:MAG: ABC transporter ATP-binding protein [Bacilli bacterium]|nr:ABC transporter ATP-binding protein [Bacilli bacterium]